MNAKNIIEACNRQMKQIKEKQQAMQECEEYFDLEDMLLLLECTAELLATHRFTAEEREAMNMVCYYADTAIANFTKEVGHETVGVKVGKKHILLVRAMLTASEIADKGKG